VSASASLHLVDPDLRDLLDRFPSVEQTLAALLNLTRAEQPLVPDGDETVEVIACAAPGPAGAPDVALLLYRPRHRQAPLPCVLHMHGGGYVFGAAATDAAQHRTIAAALGCCVVSVDYRLAPETPFPGAIEDCYAALTWLCAEARALGVDPARIGVMGESAGGGLAAALALLARDRGGPALAFQHLIYPMIDDRTGAGAGAHPYTGAFVWTPQHNQCGWSALLGVAPGSPGVSAYAAAARARDLSGLPPTFISTGALDLFLEEDIEYARRLTRAGVPVELHVYPGAFHGFDYDPSAAISIAARRDSHDALSRALYPRA
jgi:triacylglycerol lipase